MLYFGIPLRSKASANDWQKVVADFNATLASILHQTDPNFRVVVACTDIPDLQRDDERVEYIPVSPVYKTIDDSMYDKGLKKTAIAEYIKDRGGGFIMLVDADDLVSCRIAALVNSDPQVAGYIAWKGYELDDRTHKLRHAPRFWNLCGTCAVINYVSEELPRYMDHSKRYIFNAPHKQWLEKCRQANKELKPFPFPAVIYRIHTGENHSLLTRGDSWKRKLWRTLVPSFAPSPTLREEFALGLPPRRGVCTCGQ